VDEALIEEGCEEAFGSSLFLRKLSLRAMLLMDYSSSGDKKSKE
jgi:hypothetical protein